MQAEQERWRGRRQAVDAIEHAAVTGQQRAAVLEPGVALEHALDEVADDRHQRDQLAQSASHGQNGLSNSTRADVAATATAASMPAANPSQVLPGLTCGASLRRPNARPPK